MRELIDRLDDIIDDIDNIKWFLEGKAKNSQYDEIELSGVLRFYEYVGNDLTVLHRDIIRKFGDVKYEEIRRIAEESEESEE